MNCKTAVTWLISLALLAALAMPAAAQQQTGAITGRATDTSGGALPGVTVAITSPNMIGGARTAVTDEQGVYRFTLLPGGEYTVSFTLPGFSTLNVQGVNLNAGATATINGKMEVAALQESVTVTSQTPTIDLEKANVAVNWDQQKLDEIPYSRSLTGLISLIPGLYATSYDVGGSNFGTGSGPSARTFGRSGGGVVSYDGMIWDQTYGDYGTYEEAQITTAAKGADAMNPGLTMNLIVKSGSNSFKGVGSANYQSGDFQSDNITDALLKKGYAPGVNKFTSHKDYYGEVGGPILRDRLWFYASHRDASAGLLIPGFIRLSDRQQAEFYTKLQDPTGKITYQVTKNNKFEAMAQVGRKWQPYRSASRYVPLESTQNQDSWSLVGPSFKWQSVLSSRSTFDASLQRGGYWWPDVPWTTDVRKTDLATNNGPTRGAFLETDRTPRRWQYGATYAYFANLWNRNHELKTGYLGWRNMQSTENLGYPNQQQYRYRSLTGDLNCDEAHNYDGCFTRPDSVLVYDYQNTTASGEWYSSGYFNDKITLSRKLTLNVGVRYDRYSSFLPEQGNPGTGPFATKNIFEYRGEDNYPIYSTIVPRVSAVYDITGEGRVAVRGSYGRYVGGSSGASANPGPGASNVNPNAIITRTYSNWDGTIPYVPIPANLTSTSGGGTQRTIDANLKGPFVNEYTAGLDLGLSRVMTVQFNYVRKIDGNGNQSINVALPYEAYTATRTGVDPGRDNVTGTADDQPLIVYSVPRTYPTFGQNIERIVQAEGRNRYHAMGVTLNKQYSNNYSFLVAFDADYRDLRDNTPRNPNEALYGPQSGNISGSNLGTGNYQFARPSWNYVFRVSGSYQLPWGFLYGSSLGMQSGDYFFREVQVRDANNVNVTIRVEPQAGRYAWTKLWDNRITKRIKTFGNQSIEGEFNLYNTLNTNTITDQTNRVGSTYLQPTEIIAARVFKLGVKYRF
ncbi:MAG: carboxypeptidase regulatory-like domain-containing protein [Acidobacteriota bacterium]|nr:carboxypeptidase regulatory-like domain-containing protein [Acidobacteriota bacterium]